MYCLLACCFPIGGIYLLRAKAREAYGIEGDTLMDAVWSVFCPACVNCQTAAEIQARAEG